MECCNGASVTPMRHERRTSHIAECRTCIAEHAEHAACPIMQLCQHWNVGQNCTPVPYQKVRKSFPYLLLPHSIIFSQQNAVVHHWQGCMLKELRGIELGCQCCFTTELSALGVQLLQPIRAVHLGPCHSWDQPCRGLRLVRICAISNRANKGFASTSLCINSIPCTAAVLSTCNINTCTKDVLVPLVHH